MPDLTASAAFLLTNRIFLTGSGGIQWCTAEYVRTLEAAGLRLRILAYDVDRSWRARLARRLRPRPFRNILPDPFIRTTAGHLQNAPTPIVFLNNAEALPFAMRLRAIAKRARFVFLSHGAEVTDVINSVRLAPELTPRFQRNARWVGELIQQELRLRTAVDGTICISAADLEVERWLGSERVIFLPRQIIWRPLNRVPERGRVGTIATLNHGPNLHGLRKFFDAVDRDNMSIRLVGNPPEIGKQLQASYRSVTYLGGLTDASLVEEAGTWSCFVNPIFSPARGASTKVATGLGWGLPVLTTPEGARGYNWDTTALPLAHSAEELAHNVSRLAWCNDPEEGSRRALAIVELAPSLQQSADAVREFVELISTS